MLKSKRKRLSLLYFLFPLHFRFFYVLNACDASLISASICRSNFAKKLFSSFKYVLSESIAWMSGAFSCWEFFWNENRILSISFAVSLCQTSVLNLFTSVERCKSFFLTHEARFWFVTWNCFSLGWLVSRTVWWLDFELRHFFFRWGKRWSILKEWYPLTCDSLQRTLLCQSVWVIHVEMNVLNLNCVF